MLLMAWSNDDTRYKDKLQQYSYCICDNSACSDIILYCIAYAGVICLYCHFVIFLLVLISFPTAKSFLQRIFTPKKFFLALRAKKFPTSYLFPTKKGKTTWSGADQVKYIYISPGGVAQCGSVRNILQGKRTAVQAAACSDHAWWCGEPEPVRVL